MGVCVLERWLHDTPEASNPSPGDSGSMDNGSGGHAITDKEDRRHHPGIADEEPMPAASQDRCFSGSPTGPLESRQGAG
jgi:hypothetical protein